MVHCVQLKPHERGLHYSPPRLPKTTGKSITGFDLKRFEVVYAGKNSTPAPKNGCNSYCGYLLPVAVGPVQHVNKLIGQQGLASHKASRKAPKNLLSSFGDSYNLCLLNTQHLIRLLHRKKEHHRQVLLKHQAIKSSVEELQQRKARLLKLTRQNQKLAEADNKRIALAVERKTRLRQIRQARKEAVLMAHARAQELRQRIAKGIAAARERLYDQRNRAANTIRHESQVIMQLIHEMREQDIQWKRRSRARVLLGRRSSSLDVPKRNVALLINNDIRTAVPNHPEDVNLHELEQELEAAMQEETTLSDELLELQELLACLASSASQRHKG